MIARRELLASSVFSSLLGHDRGDTVPGAADVSERSAEEMVKALRDIHSALEEQRSFTDILPLRQRMVEFLRSNAKFPDFIDVGVDTWFAAYDWHVRHLQPTTLNRDASGRYTLTFLVTTLVLKTDSDRNFISIPYDNR